MSLRHAKSFGVCFLLLGCLVAGGCAAHPSTEPYSPTRVNLERLGNAYIHATSRLRHPPANLDDLMPDLEDQGAPEEILRSPNDGEKFEIVWGVELRGLKARGSDVPVVAYEKLGTDGKRHVLRGRATVLLLSESELKASVFPPGYSFPF